MVRKTTNDILVRHRAPINQWSYLMKRKILSNGRTLALLCIGLLASASVFADKPSWAGGNNNKHGNDGESSRSESHNNRDSNNDRDREGNDHYADRDHRDDREHHDRDRTYSSRYFDHDRRNSIHDYYSERKHSGRCPPGLAKRDNGCVPPGHARQWAIGQRLPRDVIFYNLDPRVAGYLGPPPPRHRFVRVASDILLIAVGTGMVLDAIDDLGRD